MNLVLDEAEEVSGARLFCNCFAAYSQRGSAHREEHPQPACCRLDLPPPLQLLLASHTCCRRHSYCCPSIPSSYRPFCLALVTDPHALAPLRFPPLPCSQAEDAQAAGPHPAQGRHHHTHAGSQVRRPIARSAGSLAGWDQTAAPAVPRANWCGAALGCNARKPKAQRVPLQPAGWFHRQPRS